MLYNFAARNNIEMRFRVLSVCEVAKKNIESLLSSIFDSGCRDFLPKNRPSKLFRDIHYRTGPKADIQKAAIGLVTFKSANYLLKAFGNKIGD